MPRSVSAQELVFELGYPSGPLGQQVGLAVVEVRVPVTPLLRRRIPEVIQANEVFGRERACIDPDQPVETRALIFEEVKLRSVQLVVWNDGRLGARAVDSAWTVLRCRAYERLEDIEASEQETASALP